MTRSASSSGGHLPERGRSPDGALCTEPREQAGGERFGDQYLGCTRASMHQECVDECSDGVVCAPSFERQSRKLGQLDGDGNAVAEADLDEVWTLVPFDVVDG